MSRRSLNSLTSRLDDLEDDLPGDGLGLKITLRDLNADGDLVEETRLTFGPDGSVESKEVVDGPAEYVPSGWSPS